jgi:hypoxanthine phosphoribosyltransferase
MKEVFYTPSQVNSYLLTIASQMYKADFRPDYIVGMTRGGLIPAVKLSHYLDIPMYALDPRESNLWMAEEAFGYVPLEEQEVIKSRWDISYKKNILIIDDINDTGKTFKNLVEDWRSGCLPREDSAWNSVWHNNVKFAALIENQASDFDADFVGLEINKLENPEWCVFPWENWW